MAGDPDPESGGADGLEGALEEEMDEELDPDDESEPGSARPGESPLPLVFRVAPERGGQRIDVALAELARVSRAQIQRWIEEGRVEVDARPVRASRTLAPGESIEARPPAPEPMTLEPQAIPLVVLFEDADLIVLDKPAGLVVHPAPGHPSGTLVNALLHHCRGELAGIGGVLRPGIVHRLDRGTSGVMVAAKSDRAHQGLAAQFARHTIERVYRTYVRGLPRTSSGRIDRPIGRHPEDRQRMSVRSRSGRRAVTRWQVLRRDRANKIAELEIRPETGRTHQIRVHLASAGLPLVGDVVYGRARGRAAQLGRPALHAEQLGFEHPITGLRHHFEAPLPADLRALVASLELEHEDAPEPTLGPERGPSSSPGREER